MRNFSIVHKGDLMRRYRELRRDGCAKPYAALAEEFRCDRELAEAYIRARLQREENAKKAPTTAQLMRINDRIEVRSKKNPRLVVYCDASRRDNALAMLEAMGG